MDGMGYAATGNVCHVERLRQLSELAAETLGEK